VSLEASAGPKPGSPTLKRAFLCLEKGWGDQPLLTEINLCELILSSLKMFFSGMMCGNIERTCCVCFYTKTNKECCKLGRCMPESTTQRLCKITSMVRGSLKKYLLIQPDFNFTPLIQ